MAIEKNLETVKGDDFARIVRFLETDITNYLVFLTVKKRKKDTDENAVLKTTNGIGKDTEHSNPINGETVLTILSEDMDVEAGNYYYDIQFRDNNGITKTLLYGNFKILQDYTTRIG